MENPTLVITQRDGIADSPSIIVTRNRGTQLAVLRRGRRRVSACRHLYRARETETGNGVVAAPRSSVTVGVGRALARVQRAWTDADGEGA